MDANRFAEEYEYLDGVMAAIEGRIAELLSRLGGSASDLIRSRREMYDEGRHLVLTFEDAVELSGLNEAVDRESKMYLDCKAEYERLVLLHRSAYFGRFDFRESGAEGGFEKFYIGARHCFPKRAAALSTIGGRRCPRYISNTALGPHHTAGRSRFSAGKLALRGSTGYRRQDRIHVRYGNGRP
jgi:hypothetical protein